MTIADQSDKLTILTRKNQQLYDLAKDAQRCLAEIIADAASNSNPRYPGHLLQKAQDIQKIATEMDAIRNYC